MEHICRTCLRYSEKLVPLLDATELIYKIEEISSVKIILEENMPSEICNECVSNVNKFYNFRKVIINSDLDLKNKQQALKNASMCKTESDLEMFHSFETIVIEKLTELTSCKTENEKDTPTASVKPEIPPKSLKQLHKEISQIMKPTKIKKVSPEGSSETMKPKKNENLLILKQPPEENPETVKPQKSQTNSEQCQNENPEPPKPRRGHRSGPKRFLLKTNFNRLTRMLCCTKCEFTAETSREMNTHKAAVHFTMGVCNVCGKSMRTYNLKRHIQDHYGYKCRQCGKFIKYYAKLRTHMYEHKGNAMSCKICGKIFYYPGDLNKHVKKHGSEVRRMTNCEICGKHMHSSSMKRHMRSHTGERPYPCSYCKKGFSSTHALKTHTRMHTKEKPYKCEYCPMAFPQKVSLRTHLKSKHSDIQAENMSA